MSEPVWMPTEKYIKRAKVYKWFDCFPDYKCRLVPVKNGSERIYHIYAPYAPNDDEKEWMESERDYELNVEKADVTITLATDVKAIMKARRAKR